MSTKKPKKAAPLKPANPSALNPKDFQPITEDQQNYLSAIRRSTIIIAEGLAGTGKTAVAVAAAIEALRNGQVKQIVVSKPIVEAGNHAVLGFLPGDLFQKSAPYFANVSDEFEKQLGKETFKSYLSEKQIIFTPIQLLRGVTFSSAFVIIDEFQNVNKIEAKLIITRLAKDSKMVLNGDPKQSDIPVDNGLKWFKDKLQDIPSLTFVELREVVRHGIIGAILKRLES